MMLHVDSTSWKSNRNISLPPICVRYGKNESRAGLVSHKHESRRGAHYMWQGKLYELFLYLLHAATSIHSLV